MGAGKHWKVGWSQQRGQPVQTLGDKKVLSITEELKGMSGQNSVSEGRGL